MSERPTKRSRENRGELGAGAFWVRLYRAMLVLAPQSFRGAYGAAMVETFARRAAEARRNKRLPGRLFFVGREILGLALAALRERLPGRQMARRGEKRRPGERLSSVLRETRHAIRRLAKRPGFTAATVLTLGLAIGANTAVFTLVDSVVLRPLPYPDSERLVWLDHAAPGIGTERGLDMTHGLYELYRTEARSFDEMAIWVTTDVTLTGTGQPERLEAGVTTASLFSALRVPPRLGRTLAENDDYSDGTGVVVISHDLWVRRFGSDPKVIGRTIEANGTPLEIVGVMSKDFAFPSPETKLWAPLSYDATSFGSFSRRGIGRLKPGVTAAEAEVDLRGLMPGLVDMYPVDQMKQVIEGARVTPLVVGLKDHVVGDARRTLWLLLGSVGFVLLIACANVGNLFLVRAEDRAREVAVRAALGASRGDLVRHSLVESTLLVGTGALLGLLLARWAIGALVALGPQNIPRLHQVGMDAGVLAFTLGLMVVASLLFGAIPVLGSRSDLLSGLKEGARGSTSGRVRLRARTALIVAQVSLALVLLVGAGLMARSFWNLTRIDPHFDAKSVLTFQLGLSGNDYPDRESAVAFHQELIERLRSLPGVEAVGATTCLPLCSAWNGSPIQEEGYPPEPGEVPPVVALRRISAGYIEALRIPLLAGRTLKLSDQQNLTGAVLVSRALAQLYWPGLDPIGKRIHHAFDAEDPDWYTIVGVVEDTPIRELTEAPSRILYMPLLHTSGGGVSPFFMSYAVRTSTPALDLVPLVRAEVASMDRGIPIAHVRTLGNIVSDSTIEMAFTMVMLVLAASVALILGIVGIYSVISYMVSRRQGEIGVRIALGAEATDISHMVLRQGGIAAAAGLFLGLLVALGLTRLMTALVYDVSPTDPATFAGVAALLFGVALLASYLPARRAARVDPMEALRSE